MNLCDIDTPAVVIDLDVVEDNIRRWQAYCDAQGLKNRPHIKTHKLPVLAWKQIEAGAVGVTVQKLGEAEVMAAAGIRDVFLPYNILGASKLERLVRLTEQVEMKVTTDDETVARGLSKVMAGTGRTLPVLVECDTGAGRVGVQSPQAAFDLARLIDDLPALSFGGLMTYPARNQSPQPFFDEALALFQRVGMPVETVSSGGTPGMWHAAAVKGVTEYRVGNYIYNDRSAIATGAATLSQCAMRVLVTVVSVPTRVRAIIDGGSKTFSSDKGTLQGFGYVTEYPAAEMAVMSEEHGHLNIAACDRTPQVGERLTLIPNHACAVTNLHNEIVAVRGERVVAIWPVAARGSVK